MADPTAGAAFIDAADLLNPARSPDAACAGMPLEIFFPNPTDDRSPAIAVCESCPLQRLCASWGVSHRESGIWGGLLLNSGRPDNVPRRWKNPYPLQRSDAA